MTQERIMRPIAIFDIDGTIFRSSLTIELFKRLVREEIFRKDAMIKVRKSERKWINREGHYEDYIRDVVSAYLKAMIGVKRSQVVRASRKVIREQKYRTYRFTRNLLQKIGSRYVTIGISGSPLEVVGEYNKFLKFDKFYGSEFGVDKKGRYTGVVLHEPPRYKKEVVIRYLDRHKFSLKGSIGVGDTESDIGFLDLVEKPIAFNPNARLAQYAKKRNWPIVIERKDLIIEFNPEKVKYIKV